MENLTRPAKETTLAIGGLSPTYNDLYTLAIGNSAGVLIGLGVGGFLIWQWVRALEPVVKGYLTQAADRAEVATQHLATISREMSLMRGDLGRASAKLDKIESALDRLKSPSSPPRTARPE